MKRLTPSFGALVALVLGFSLLASACGTVVPYAAVVAGQRISQRDLDDELRAIRGNRRYYDQVKASFEQQGGKVDGAGTGTFDASFVSQVLDRQIIFAAIHQGIVHRHLNVSNDDLDRARQEVVDQLAPQSSSGQAPSSAEGQQIFNSFGASYRNLLVRRNAEVDVLQAALAKGSTPDPRQYFEQHKADFANQACASHILVAIKDASGQNVDFTASKAKADAIEDQLAKGADFATLAHSDSADTQSAAQGGALGCSDPSSYVPEFAGAVKSQPVGQVGPPVRTQFGWHIIKVTARPPTFQDVADQVNQQLQQASQSALTDYLASTLQRDKIRINPRYGSYTKQGQRPHVVPPQAPPAPKSSGATTTSTPVGP